MHTFLVEQFHLLSISMISFGFLMKANPCCTTSLLSKYMFVEYVKELRYLWVLFTSDRRREPEIYRLLLDFEVKRCE